MYSRRAIRVWSLLLIVGLMGAAISIQTISAHPASSGAQGTPTIRVPTVSAMGAEPSPSPFSGFGSTSALPPTTTPTAATQLQMTRADGLRHFNLSNKDNHRSVAVHTGDEIRVQLTGEKTGMSIWAWSAATAANSQVLRRDAAGTSPNGDSTSVFHARASGTTTIDASFRCLPTSPSFACSHVVVLFQVTIKVR